MNYPLISEYIEAIKSAEDNFGELSYLRPVLGEDGLPVMTSGNFAVVFKMKDEQSGKFYAVKCFTKEQEGRAEAYCEIAKELENVSSPYILSIRYLDKELFVDTDQTTETEFPVLLMDWVEGKTLDKYLRENLDDKYALEMLAYRFSQLAQWLIPQPFAHVDLKPDNILVREDGTLVLVDYDGMYVPTMKGQRARELGSPDFRHPQRTENDFDEHIDDFPLVSILLSLIVLSINSSKWEEFGSVDRLLFTKEDYSDITKSRVFRTIFYMSSIKEIQVLFSVFLLAHSHYNQKEISNTIRCLLPNSCTYTESYHSAIASKNDLVNCFRDEKGSKYSSDRKKLLQGCELAWWDYSILEGTETICNDAFFFSDVNEDYWDGGRFNEGDRIIIPKSVRLIGRNPFAQCSVSIECHSEYFIIENKTLYTRDKKTLISYFGRDHNIEIPEGVTRIGDRAFYHIYTLESIKLPLSLEYIGDDAFCMCKMERVIIPANVRYIGKRAFRLCKNLSDVTLPNSLQIIGDFAFYGCPIHSLEIPPSVVSIGVNPFFSLPTVGRQIKVNSNSMLYEDDGDAIYTKNKKFLISYYSDKSIFKIPDTVTHIGKRAFSSQNIKQIEISKKLEFIGDEVFLYCCYQTEWGPNQIKMWVTSNKEKLIRDYLRKNKLISHFNIVIV